MGFRLKLNMNTIMNEADYRLKSNVEAREGIVHWANPTPNRIEEYRERHGDDFRIVFYRTESPMETYAIPFSVLSTTLTEENLQPNGRKRWVTKIQNGELKIHLKDRKVQSVDVSMYLEAVLTTEVRNEDCATGMREIPDESVACIITSPPYKEGDGYSDELMRSWLSEAYRILEPDSCLFINFGHLARMKGRCFKVAMMAEDTGFGWNDTITWIKNHYTPLQRSKRVNNLTEFIFLMTKGEPTLDRLSIGVPYADKSQVNRYGNGVDLKCGGNVWYIKYETINSVIQKRHKDRFPVELPLKALKLAGVVGTVVDPFCGSGTTGTACVEYWKEEQKQISFIGFELNPEHVETANDRWLSERERITLQ